MKTEKKRTVNGTKEQSEGGGETMNKAGDADGESGEGSGMMEARREEPGRKNTLYKHTHVPVYV